MEFDLDKSDVRIKNFISIQSKFLLNNKKVLSDKFNIQHLIGLRVLFNPNI